MIIFFDNWEKKVKSTLWLTANIKISQWDFYVSHSYYKELVRKPGKLQRNKQRSKELCWMVHGPAQSFVLTHLGWIHFKLSCARAIFSYLQIKKINLHKSFQNHAYFHNADGTLLIFFFFFFLSKDKDVSRVCFLVFKNSRGCFMLPNAIWMLIFKLFKIPELSWRIKKCGCWTRQTASKQSLNWKTMFFTQWHRHTRKKKSPSSPNRSRTYDLPISTSTLCYKHAAYC